MALKEIYLASMALPVKKVPDPCTKPRVPRLIVLSINFN